MGGNAGIQTAAAMALLLAGMWVLRRSTPRLAYTAAVLAAALVSLLMLVAHLASDYFTDEGVNEAVIYHLRYGLEGAGFAEYLKLEVAVALGVLAAAALLWWLARTGRRPGSGPLARIGNVAALAFVALSVALQPAAAALVKLMPGFSRGAAAATGPADKAAQAEFSQFYRQPRVAAVGAPRNLVCIYAESLERTYFDEQLFPGLIHGLRALEKQAVSFTEIGQATGTSWTIAGMVASQCGIPLFTPSGGNAMTGLDAFLPEATCLGDLLAREGYRLAYYGGAQLRFAGKGKFYETHGFHEVVGRDELLAKVPDPSYVNAWGLYDDVLFGLAFEKFSELGRSNKPFALFMLTLDTHQPDGHVSRSCASMPYGDGTNPILNAVHCSDRLISEFVQRIRESPWGKDTVVVVASDHLALQNTAYDRLKAKPRRNLLMVLDPRRDEGMQVATAGSTLDVAATLLPFLGYQGEVGLGADLMRADAESTARSAHIRSRLEAWREPLLQFWAFPKIEDYVEVDPRQRLVTIDGRRFAMPAMIEVDDDLQPVIRFPKPRRPVTTVAAEDSDGKPFMLAAFCDPAAAGSPDARVCLFAGHDKRVRTEITLNDATRLSAADVRRLLKLRS